MVEVLLRILMLMICSVVLLPALNPARFSTMISACGFSLYSMILSVIFAWVADEVDCFVVLALLQVAF